MNHDDARTVAEYIEHRQVEGSTINQALREQERKRMAEATVEETKKYTLDEKGELPAVNFEGAQNISGEDIAPTPSAEDYIKAVVSLFGQIDEKGFTLKDLDSFEQVMVGVMVRMFKLMQEKQRGYGKSNISKAGLHGLFTRATDKIERAKNIVGDPVEQIGTIESLVDDVLENGDGTTSQMDDFFDKVRAIVKAQEFAEESIEDTLIDLADYGLIMYMVQLDAWGKDMEENQ